MISIDLTPSQKIQIVIFALVFSLAGYLLLKGSQPPPDLTIASWVERQLAPKNPALPVSPTNPLDPAKTSMVTIFACFDGRLSITEYPPARNLKASFDFSPDTRRKTFTLFQDLLVKIEAMEDSYQRALSYSAYRVTVGLPPVALFRTAALSPEQRNAEKKARDEMTNSVAVLENGAQTGLFKPDAYNQVMAALKAYKAVSGDPTKDATKAGLAHKVVALALQYLGLMQDEKSDVIKKYVATVDSVLTHDQKTKVQKLADALVIRTQLPRKPKIAAMGP